MTADQPDVSGALAPLGSGNFPAPTELKTILITALNERVARIRADRTVTCPEDAFPLVRSLNECQERMGDYQRAFAAVAGEAKNIAKEEYAEVVPEQDGVPLSDLTVPTAGGDIRFKRDMRNTHDIDMHQVVAVLAAQTAARWTGEQWAVAGPEEFAIEVALSALEFVGAAKPKVTAVRALAAQLSRDGDDRLAAVARSAIVTTRKFHGVKVERERPKP